MKYNTDRPKIRIREYGRYAQEFASYAATVKEDTYRKKIEAALLEVMMILSPQPKITDDYHNKLWDHLVLLSDMKLVGDSPYPAPEINPNKHETKPLPYPKHDLRYRHYGINVGSLIKKTIGFEDLEKKRIMSILIANYMKIVAQSFARENVTDEMIKLDLEMMSGGKLTVNQTEISVGENVKFQQQVAKPGKKKKFKNFGGGAGGGRHRHFQKRRKF